MTVIGYVLTSTFVSVLLSVDLGYRRCVMKCMMHNISNQKKTYMSIMLYVNSIFQLSFPLVLYSWLFYGTPSPAPAITCIIIAIFMTISYVLYEYLMKRSERVSGLYSLFMLAFGTAGTHWSFIQVKDVQEVSITTSITLFAFIIIYDSVFACRALRLMHKGVSPVIS